MPRRQGVIQGICITGVPRKPMQEVEQARLVAGLGIEGDRYALGAGSYNRGKPGYRQVTLINARFFAGSSFVFAQSRRNICVEGMELYDLIGREFSIGQTARLRGLEYCDPCLVPSRLANTEASFQEEFFERGGIVAEVLVGGAIQAGDVVMGPQKYY